jgi:hypothetical protein
LFDVLEISRFILFPLLFPAALISWIAGSDRGEKPSGKSPPPNSNPFSDGEFGKNLSCSSSTVGASANCPFQFLKRRQLFIGVHNETLSVIAVSIDIPDRSPFTVQR